LPGEASRFAYEAANGNAEDHKRVAEVSCRDEAANLTMDTMSGERFTNARVHEWLTPQVDAVVGAMHTTRVQLNSAALWWFCRRLTAEERAEILGEYVKVQALSGREKTNTAAKPTGRRGRRKAEGSP
jgi:hypothetical protein